MDENYLKEDILARWTTFFRSRRNVLWSQGNEGFVDGLERLYVDYVYDFFGHEKTVDNAEHLLQVFEMDVIYETCRQPQFLL